jgi:hypothetical protein
VVSGRSRDAPHRGSPDELPVISGWLTSPPSRTNLTLRAELTGPAGVVVVGWWGAERSYPRRRLGLSVVLVVAITVALLVIGRAVTPNYRTSVFGATGTQAVEVKSWLATGMLVLAAGQLILALWMYGRLPLAGPAPTVVRQAHRVEGGLLFLLSLPIAIHCLLTYGVQLTDLRVTAHSVAGCFLYGAFAAKVLIVRSRRLPGWALPVAGGTLVVVVVMLWYSSALWYFNGYQLP